MSIPFIDVIIALFSLAILISAWKKGFLRQLTDLIALAGSFLLAGYMLRRYSLDSSWFLFLFLALRFVFGLIQSVILPKKHSFLSLLDRLAALLAGCVRIYLLCALLFWALSYVPMAAPYIHQSIVYPYFKEVDTYVRQTTSL